MVVLLALYVVWLGIYLALPQLRSAPPAEVDAWLENAGLRGHIARTLGLLDVAGNPGLWLTHGLFVANLIAGMTRRFRWVRRSIRLPRELPAASRFPWRHTIATPLSPDQVEAELVRRGYRTLRRQGMVYGLRGRVAAVGHMVFHIGFIVLFAGMVALSVGRKPIEAFAWIGENEAFDLHQSWLPYRSRPIATDDEPLRLVLGNVQAELREGGRVDGFAAEVVRDDGRRATVAINQPFRSGRYLMIPSAFGFMVGWVVLTRDDRMVDGGWVKLMPFPEDSMRARVELPGQGRVAFVALANEPDGAREKGHDTSRYWGYRSHITWRGRKIYDGILTPAQSVDLDEERRFRFLPEVREYVVFRIREERGFGLVVLAFAIMILGLVVRYARTRKEVLAICRDDRSEVCGRTEILPALFKEEMEDLVAKLERDATAVPAGGPDA